MSTNATVGILDKDGNITYNVVWHDGYISHLICMYMVVMILPCICMYMVVMILHALHLH